MFASIVTTELMSKVRRTRVLAIYYSVAFAFAVGAFAALVTAAGIALARFMRPEYAAVIVGLALLSISVMVLAYASVWSAKQKRHSAMGQSRKTIIAASAAALVPLLATNRASLTLLAVLAGYVLAKRKTAVH